MKQTTIKKEFLTAKEAAEFLSISLPNFHNYVSKGVIPYRKPEIGPKRYKVQDLRTWMGNKKRNKTKTKK